MLRHRLCEATWASLHARLVTIPGIWKKDPEPLRRFVEAVAYVLRTAGAAGVIRVELTLHAGIIELSVTDNGIGLPKAGGSPASSGLQLVQALAKQIGGTFTANAQPGARCSLLFPLKKHPRSLP